MYKIEDLYLEYKQDIFYYLMSLTHNHTLSEDLLSDTFVKAMISLPSFKGQSTVKTWLLGIARNTWLQHIRSHKKTVSYDELLNIYLTENMDNHMISRQTLNRIQELLEQKENRVKQILWMRVDGYPYSAIGKSLNISENSARVIDFRTKRWLKEILEKEGLL